jgi:amino acid permease
MEEQDKKELKLIILKTTGILFLYILMFPLIVIALFLRLWAVFIPSDLGAEGLAYLLELPVRITSHILWHKNDIVNKTDQLIMEKIQSIKEEDPNEKKDKSGYWNNLE